MIIPVLLLIFAMPNVNAVSGDACSCNSCGQCSGVENDFGNCVGAFRISSDSADSYYTDNSDVRYELINDIEGICPASENLVNCAFPVPGVIKQSGQVAYYCSSYDNDKRVIPYTEWQDSEGNPVGVEGISTNIDMSCSSPLPPSESGCPVPVTCAELQAYCTTNKEHSLDLSGICPSEEDSCIRCESDAVWNPGTERCEISCTSAGGSCLTSSANGVIIDSTTDCPSGDSCVTCNPGYHADSLSGECVSDCGLTTNTCSSSGNCCETDPADPTKQLYCSFGSEGISSPGYCCPKESYARVDRFGNVECVPQQLCNGCTESPGTQEYFNNPLCLRPDSPAYTQSCCQTSIYGITGNYPSGIKVYDTEGNVVSG